MEHPSSLRSLTPELLVHALSFADAVSLLAASRACAALRAAANEEQVWTALLWRHHSRILRLLFHGQPPRENDGLSPKQAYFEFARSWKLLAQRRSGRLLLKIDGEAAGGLAGTFGVYDATEYAPQHPGFELIVEDAAEEEDSTSTFAAASHTSLAKAILRSLAVPGLECIRYDGEDVQLAALRRRTLHRSYLLCLRAWARQAVRWAALLAAALVLRAACGAACSALADLCATLAAASAVVVAPAAAALRRRSARNKELR